MLVLQPGDQLRFTADCFNPLGFKFLKNQTLTLVEPTDEAPHGIRSRISNWLVDGPNGRTVWSSIYLCIESGLLKKV